LRQIIVNLVGNAIKFTEEGEVAVRVESEPDDGQEHILHFTVCDTGIGISPEKQKSIFEPFVQADTSTTRKYGGTGLGLTISTRLVEMMGGKLWVESETGRGTKFHFTARVGIHEAKVVASRNGVLPNGLRGVKALVVDDNRSNRVILEGMLKRWEMETASAEGGRDALVRLSEAGGTGKPFALVLTDLMMPEMDGFALVERMLETPEGAAATIMMLSSGGQRGDAARCKQLGVAAYLTKPIRQSELRDAIVRALNLHEQVGETPLVTRKFLREDRAAGASLRVLVADDNPVNQRLVVRLMEKRGHQVAVAANGAEAVEAIGKNTFDLVFMDVQMPKMDGFEATAKIREREKGTDTRVPVIALTAHAMKGDRERCLAAGMDGYLSKPIQTEALEEILEVQTARRMDTTVKGAGLDETIQK
jgi:two-component system sensor histidine kinase/response regulator